MTEMQMLEKLEAIRKASEDGKCIYYAMGNGSDIFCTVDPLVKEAKKEDGYWVVAIFEHGHMVQA